MRQVHFNKECLFCLAYSFLSFLLLHLFPLFSTFIILDLISISLSSAVDHFRYSETFKIERAHIEELPLSAAFAAMGLGFALSLLVFMDQNIAEAMVNNPCNKWEFNANDHQVMNHSNSLSHLSCLCFFLKNCRLKKGCAYHLDLFVVGILNGFLSIYGFPWMHGVLPHSPLHLRSLADVEERVDGGHVYEMWAQAISSLELVPQR